MTNPDWIVIAIDMKDPTYPASVIFTSSKHDCAQIVKHYSREYRLKGYRLELWKSLDAMKQALGVMS